MDSFKFNDMLMQDAEPLPPGFLPQGPQPYKDIPTHDLQPGQNHGRMHGASHQQQLSKDQWEALRVLITRLYIEEGKTLKKVAHTVGEQCGFTPTKRQLTRKFEDWSLRKNGSRTKKDTIAALKAERSSETPSFHPSSQRVLETRPSMGPSLLTSNDPPLRTGNNIHSVIMDPNLDQGHASFAMFEEHSYIPIECSTPRMSARDSLMQASPARSDPLPFDKLMIDVIESPNLTRLFAALKLEIPDDCPDSILPPSNFAQPEATERQYISNSEMMRIFDCHNQDENDHGQLMDEEVHKPYKSRDLVCWAPRSRQRRNPIPWKAWGLDADFSSGEYYYSSPLNELCPFPACQDNISWKLPPRETLFSLNQRKCLEYGDSIAKLSGHLSETDPIMLCMIENQADTYWKLGKLHQAASSYEKLLGLTQAITGLESRESLGITCKLADYLVKCGRYRQADQLLHNLPANIISLLKPEDPVLLGIISTRGRIAGDMGNHEEAEALLRQLVQIRISSFGLLHSDTLFDLLRLGSQLAYWDRPAASDRLFYDLLQLYRSASQSDDNQYAQVQTAEWLCWNLRKQGKFEESRNCCQAFLRQARMTLGSEDRITLGLEYQLAKDLGRLGRIEESEKLFRKTLDLQSRLFCEDDPRTSNSILGLAELLTSLERHGEATELHERRFRSSLDVRGAGDEITFYAFCNIVESYGAEERFEEAYSICQNYLNRLRALGGEGDAWIVRVQEWMEPQDESSEDEEEDEMESADALPDEVQGTS